MRRMVDVQGMPEKITLEEIDEQELDGFEPTLKPIGYHLKPDSMRPSVWHYEEGESNREHRHKAQEELYTVLDGLVRVSFEEGDIELKPGDFTVVPSDKWRQITAEEDSTLFAVGAPNESHDAEFADEK